MSVSCEFCLLSGKGLCFGLIIRSTKCGLSECERSLDNEEALAH